MWHRHRHITSVGVLSLEVTGSVETRRAAQVDRRGQGTWSPRGLIYAQSTAPLPACSWPLSTECAGGPVPREALAGFRGRWRHLIPDLLARVVTILGREASDDLPVHVGVELCEGVLLHLEERHLASEAVLLLVPAALGREVEGAVFDELPIPVLAARALERIVVDGDRRAGGGVLLPEKAVGAHHGHERVRLLRLELRQRLLEVRGHD
mmetsp:Transcript_17848/g.51960  ORF Transcript_17848/g.51960 Transcript_17848/m.51960 type:complete len:209 (-) Transcript_17848:394-1020(-)